MPWAVLSASLSRKLFVCLLLILLPVIALEAYNHDQESTRLESSALDHQMGMTRAMATLVQSEMEHARALVSHLARDPALRMGDRAPVRAYLQAIAPLHSEYLAITVLAPSGLELASSLVGDEEQPTLDGAIHGQFLPATPGDQVDISGVVPIANEKLKSMGKLATAIVSAQIQDGLAGGVAGRVQIALDFDHFRHLAEKAQLGEGQEIFLTDREARLAFSMARPALSWDERDLSWFEPIKVALRGIPGRFASVSSPLGDARMVAVHPVSEYGWVVGVSVARQVALAPAAERVRAQMLGLGGVTVIVLLVGAALAWNLVHPIGKMADCAQALARGELSRRVRIRTGDELESLGNCFNNLADQLHRAVASLQDRERHWRVVTTVTQALARELDLQRAAEAILYQTLSTLGADSAGVWAVDWSRRRLQLLIRRGPSPVPAKALGEIPLDAPFLAARAAATGELQVVEDTSVLAREFVEVQPLPEARGARSIVAVPLRVGTRIVGVISYVNREPRHYSERELETIHAVAGIFAVAIDNARLYRHAEELARAARSHAAELDAVIDNMAEGVIVANVQGDVVHINHKALSILGFGPGEATPRRLEDFSALLDIRYPDGQIVPAEECPLMRALRGEVLTEHELVLNARDGRRRDLLLGASSVRDESGRVALGIVVFRDITPLREMERQREEFVSVVAHDLRSAIAVVRGYGDYLIKRADDLGISEQIRAKIEVMARGSRRLERMISDLLDVSRLEARQLKVQKQWVDIAALAKGLVGYSEELTKGHAVRLSILGDVPNIQADSGRLEQVFTNLLSNAAKYSYPDSEILVRVEPAPGEVIVSVTNLGPGIPPEEVPELFTRFYRTKTAVADRVPGLGLGLYIAKGLVEAHGGRIWVESEPGKSTTFRFALPTA
ncbi:MAG: GAF domain-containing protein [Chloroflexi bacterium]|nr:GAF domain-containing protein [Chloroflexota bacterium]